MSKQTKCAICGEPAKKEFAPFCSRRCADVDLGRWFKGSYRFESEEVPDEQDLRDLIKQEDLDK